MNTEEKYLLIVSVVVKIIAAAGSILALAIILDFMWPGNTLIEEVTYRDIKSLGQVNGRYGNSSYNVHTVHRAFASDKSFFTQVQKGDTLHLNISPVFQAVNSYYCPRFMHSSETFSLRFVSGLLLPLAMILLSTLSIRFKSTTNYFLTFLTFVLICITCISLLI
jgi:hypothetical protein